MSIGEKRLLNLAWLWFALVRSRQLSLDAARKEALDEVPLKRQEHDDGDDDGEEASGREQVEVRAVTAHEALHARGDRLLRRIRTPESLCHQQIVPHPQELEDAK